MRFNALAGKAALAAALLLASAPAAANETGQRVHRCLGAHGEIVFSGLPCQAGTHPGDSATSQAAPVVPADRCATTPQELRDRVASAIERRDPNSLAGLLQWRGVSASAMHGHLRALRELVTRPLLAIDGGNDEDAAPAGAAGHERLRIRTGSGDGLREQTFSILGSGGCFWLGW